MSYTIDEGIQDAEQHLAFLKALRETYPDTYKTEKRWVSSHLKLADCDGMDLREDSTSGIAPFIYVTFYRNIAGGRVYRAWPQEVLLDTFLTDLKTKDSNFYNLLIQKLKSTVSA